MENVRAASQRLETTLAECLPQIPTVPGTRTTKTEEREREQTRTAGLSVVLGFLTCCLDVLKTHGEQVSPTLSMQRIRALDEVSRALTELGEVVRRHLTVAFGTDTPRD